MLVHEMETEIEKLKKDFIAALTTTEGSLFMGHLLLMFDGNDFTKQIISEALQEAFLEWTSKEEEVE